VTSIKGSIAAAAEGGFLTTSLSDFSKTESALRFKLLLMLLLMLGGGGEDAVRLKLELKPGGGGPVDTSPLITGTGNSPK